MDTLMGVMLGYCVIREVIFWVSVQRLLNKLMSRNYHEYQITQDRSKMKAPVTALSIRPDENEEDLGALGGIA